MYVCNIRMYVCMYARMVCMYARMVPVAPLRYLTRSVPTRTVSPAFAHSAVMTPIYKIYLYIHVYTNIHTQIHI
jgi:hypothetical protein